MDNITKKTQTIITQLITDELDALTTTINFMEYNLSQFPQHRIEEIEDEQKARILLHNLKTQREDILEALKDFSQFCDPFSFNA
jgi:hypothetical protein